MPADILSTAVAAAAGLIGVAVGSYFTARNQKRERQQRRMNEQLAEFYSPMLALRAEMLAKGGLRLKISDQAATAWRTMMERAYQRKDVREGNIDFVERLSEERFPHFEKLTAYENRELRDTTIPAYDKMLTLFKTKMHLAEFSTIQHFPTLLEFVEIWKRWLNQSLPVEVLGPLHHSEENLYPLYEDLADNFARMQQALQEKRWWWRRHPAVMKVRGPVIAVNPFASPERSSEIRQPSD